MKQSENEEWNKLFKEYIQLLAKKVKVRDLLRKRLEDEKDNK